MVRALRRLDAFQKALVDDRPPSRRDRSEQPGRAIRFRTGKSGLPFVMPVLPHGGSVLRRDAVEKRRLVQQWMADAAVSPIHEDEGRRVAAVVPRMEVSMDERIGEAATAHGRKSIV